MSKVGFGSQKDLVAHNRTYHDEGGILVPPRVRIIASAAGPPRQTQPDSSHSPTLKDPNKPLLKVVRSPRNQKLALSFGNSTKTGEIQDKIKSLDIDDNVLDSMTILNADLIHTPEFEHELTMEYGRVWCVDINPVSSLVAIGTDELVIIFDLRSGETLYTLQVFNGSV